jgi:hypothetical protein
MQSQYKIVIKDSGKYISGGIPTEPNTIHIVESKEGTVSCKNCIDGRPNDPSGMCLPSTCLMRSDVCTNDSDCCSNDCQNWGFIWGHKCA